ncbi:hypothetical protein Mal48_22030 [Thalassoglobus polymorphus]|uniref:Uncharacterized protein n=1 Tax=Thalassoglobus polymorphus TaxID=2527994 RepID=A0A517QMU8_9PLAN|nr:hypothetical protein Mal48_22030 [Thalassoglobus polymorphus]
MKSHQELKNTIESVNDLEQFALPCAREERISLELILKLEIALSNVEESDHSSSFRTGSIKMLFVTRQILQTNSKDSLIVIFQVIQIVITQLRIPPSFWFFR